MAFLDTTAVFFFSAAVGKGGSWKFEDVISMHHCNAGGLKVESACKVAGCGGGWELEVLEGREKQQAALEFDSCSSTLGGFLVICIDSDDRRMVGVVSGIEGQPALAEDWFRLTRSLFSRD